MVYRIVETFSPFFLVAFNQEKASCSNDRSTSTTNSASPPISIFSPSAQTLIKIPVLPAFPSGSLISLQLKPCLPFHYP